MTTSVAPRRQGPRYCAKPSEHLRETVERLMVRLGKAVSEDAASVRIERLVVSLEEIASLMKLAGAFHRLERFYDVLDRNADDDAGSVDAEALREETLDGEEGVLFLRWKMAPTRENLDLWRRCRRKYAVAMARLDRAMERETR